MPETMIPLLWAVAALGIIGVIFEGVRLLPFSGTLSVSFMQSLTGISVILADQSIAPFINAETLGLTMLVMATAQKWMRFRTGAISTSRNVPKIIGTGNGQSLTGTGAG